MKARALRLELAERGLPVTEQTLRNWSREGMPHKKRNGVRHFDLKACISWIKENKAAKANRHGGIREGAGRPPSEATMPKGPQTGLGMAFGGAEADQTRRRGAEGELKRIRGGVVEGGGARPLNEDLTPLAHDQLRVLAVLLEPNESGATKAAIERLNALVALQQKQMAVAKTRGELVEADELAEAWARQVNVVRTAIEVIPTKAAKALAPLVGVPEAVVREVEEALKAAGVDPKKIGEVLARLEPSEEAEHVIRGELVALVRRALTDLAVGRRQEAA